MQPNSRKVIGALMTIGLMSAAGAASAGSFALKERSTRAQGLSFAGATAGSGGLSSMGFNPAAISLVDDGHGNGMLSGGLSIIYTNSEGQPVIGGVPVGPSQNAGGFGGLANSYVGYRLEDDILIGMSLYTPFGLTTQYDPGWLGQFDALTSKLQTFTIAPTVAWEPIPELSLAFALNVHYTNVRLTSGVGQLDGDSMDLGFSVGALWDATDSTTIGVAYQHGYNIDVEGTFNQVLPIVAQANLPAVASFGIVQDITDDFRIMGEAQWQDWSAFERIDVSVIGGGLLQSDVQAYDDAFYFALGGEYDIFDSFTMRLGAAWDQTPTNSGIVSGEVPAAVNPLATNRTPRVPDEDRLWLSIGASVDVTEHMSMDVGYSYLMTLEDPVVGLRNAPAGSSITYDGTAHIFSIGGSIKFGE